MIRRRILPRENWETRVEADGLSWHSEDGKVCWNEGAVYVFSSAEVALVRDAAREVEALYLKAAEHVVRQGLWSRLGFGEEDVAVLQTSWERRDWSLHGRFDFLFDEGGQPRMIEYNAETALSLVETAVAQRSWMAEAMPDANQFNELHEKLTATWRQSGADHVHCAWRPRHPETAGTVKYMAGVVREAGLQATLMAMHRLGWDGHAERFVDHDGEAVRCCYKMYPWDWMLREPFARHLKKAGACAFVEPAWRLMLSSKGMLTVLWELFPDHPALLPCYEDAERLRTSSLVRKPFFGREGGNVCVMEDGRVVQERGGDLGDERQVHQARVRSPLHDGFLAQLGVWMVGGEPVAVGMRESRDAIITGDSAFVPHVVE